MIVLLNFTLIMVFIYACEYQKKNQWNKAFEKVSYESFKVHDQWQSTLFTRYYCKTALNRILKKWQFMTFVFLWFIVLIFFVVITCYDSWGKWLPMILGSALPFFLLELRIQWVHGQIDQAMLPFFSALNSNILQNSDLITAMKTIPYNLNCPYICEAIEKFNLTLKSGLSEEKAFYYLKSSTSHSYLKYVYLNMAQAYLKRGDVVSLMAQLEEEYILIHVERNKRVIEMKQSRRYAWFAFGLVGIIGLRIAQKEDYLKHFYENTSFGKMTLLILSLLILMTVLLLMHISLKKIDE